MATPRYVQLLNDLRDARRTGITEEVEEELMEELDNVWYSMTDQEQNEVNALLAASK